MVSIEMWLNLCYILLEFSDQESPSMSCLRRTQPLGSHRTLTAEALLEEASVRGLSRTLNCRVENEIDRVCSAVAATISASMSIAKPVSSCWLLINSTQVPKMIRSFMPLNTFLAKHETALCETEFPALDFILIDCKTSAQFVLLRHERVHLR